MITLNADEARAALDLPSVIEALRAMFRDGCEAPVRHHHAIAAEGQPTATMLLMPAWLAGRYLGVKLVNVFPGNGARGLPAVQGVYLLFSGETGELIASIEGNELTARRTVAASALAASYLAREDAATLLVVGTGRLAHLMPHAHAAVRPVRKVLVWGRDQAKAAALARDLAGQGFAASAAADLPAAVAEADIVSSVTLSREPLVRGAWLKPGAHLDLVGGFTPEMREADDDALRRASVFIDTPGALQEAGDIVVPLTTGVLRKEEIRADLAALTRGEHPGRTRPDEITFFKSVGAAAEDLAAAMLAYQRARAATARPTP
ncbi:ornithine cyclodeaminase family protein [Chelatococcus sp. GCM10030263]|uniref:ornithine cyclodeaminase family protein n=1 Tax=Chelatococcus sp. GCM10030263 TaxID=3273387 RepID=UPI0036070E38